MMKAAKTTTEYTGKLNDLGFRIVLIPFFGLAIPLVTGIINIQTLQNWQIKISFLYTILIAFVIWEGNRFLLFSLRSYFDWFNKPVKKIMALLLSVSFFTIPVSLLMLIGWYYLFADGDINWDAVSSSTLIIMICVIFITHVYETVFLVKQSESDKLKAEQLERSRVEAELQALKSQIDPHFIFNSLNTLSYLIEKDVAKALYFNQNLADVYRYILNNKGRDLVFLREEIKFMMDYFSLLKIRFEEAVQLINAVDEVWLDTYLIPPISVQLLIENAVKHNEFNDRTPLIITLNLSGDMLIMENEIRIKDQRFVSSKVGLFNLNERYKLITRKNIIVEEGNFFKVSLPVLKIA